MAFDKLDSSVVYDCGISRNINARSISWNSSGTTLAMASSDRTTKLYTMAELLSSSSKSSGGGGGGSSVAREFATLEGHGGSIDRVRFHPAHDSVLATMSGSDATVRLWDLRSSSSATKSSVGTIDLAGSGGGNTGSNGSTVDVSWSTAATPSDGNLLAVTEKNGNVRVVDPRKLRSGGASGKPPACFLKTFALRPKIVDACVFSPSGDHLVAATSADGYGELTVWNWENEDDASNTTDNDSGTRRHVYPAHTGPIYSFCFSPNGRRLATGGGDAMVGLWDVDTMVCSATIPRCDRFVRSVSFSFDSALVATSTEEASIDLADAANGAPVGKVSMAGGGGKGRMSSAPGADEIAFHPRAHVLAFARCDSGAYTPLTIAKLTLGRQ